MGRRGIRTRIWHESWNNLQGEGFTLLHASPAAKRGRLASTTDVILETVVQDLFDKPFMAKNGLDALPPPSAPNYADYIVARKNLMNSLIFTSEVILITAAHSYVRLKKHPCRFVASVYVWSRRRVSW